MTLEESKTLNEQSSGRYLKIVFVVLILGLVLSITILAWVPPVSRDALTHHLAVPKLYLQHGGIYEIPSLKFSYYPMNLDLLYIIPLYFNNDIVPKFIHFAFGLLTAWLIFGYLRKRLDTLWALFGVLFFLSLPIIVKLSISVYVDLGLMFFSTAAIMSIFKWMESRFQFKFLLLAATCCGLALGTKYNGLVVFFILTVAIPFVYISHINRAGKEQKATSAKSAMKYQLQAAGFGILFCLAALLIFSPWMIRNYVWKANPVYPLYNSFFNPQKGVQAQPPVEVGEIDPRLQNSGKIKKGSTKWGPLALRKIVYNESWWEIALIPARIFFQGQDDKPKYFDGKLNPFLFLLPFFAFFQLKKISPDIKIEKTFFLFFTILYIFYTFFQTDMRIRYIAPVIPPLVILSIFGMHRIHSFKIRRWARRSSWSIQFCILLLAAAILSLNSDYLVKQFKYVDPFSYIGGRVGRDAYITRYRPEYTIIQYANQFLAEDARLLGLFMGNRRYYSDRNLIFGIKMFRNIVKKADSAQTVLNDLQAKKFTHLLIRFDLFNVWTAKQFNDREKKRLKVFFERGAKHVLSKNGFGLFELVDTQ